MWFGQGQNRKRSSEADYYDEFSRQASAPADAEQGCGAPLLRFPPDMPTSRDQAEDMPYVDSNQDFVDQVRYTKFQIDGLPGEKHAVLIPDTMPLSKALFAEICDVVGKDMPSMLLSAESSLRHPVVQTTQELRDSPAFAELMADARNNVGKKGDQDSGLSQFFSSAKGGFGMGSGDSSPDARRKDDSRREKLLGDFANHIMERRMGNMVSGIANAAQQSNAWIFTGPSITTFEVFLQMAKAHKDTEVFCCVATHMQDSAYMDTSQWGPELMRYMFESSVALNADMADDFEPIVLSGDLWNPGKNTTNREFHEHGFSFWSFEDEHSAESQGHPVFAWPWPWADLYLMFYHQDFNNPSPGNVDWSYRTPRMWDMHSIPIELESLAPLGSVFIGGQAHEKKRAMQLMKGGHTMIFMDNSPNMSKQMSLLVNIIHTALNGDVNSLAPFLSDGDRGAVASQSTTTQILQALSPGKILKYVERQFDAGAMEQGAPLSLADIMAILDVVRQRPRQFKERICTLDPLNESPRDVTAKLSSVMCSLGTSGPDNGSSPAQRSLALKGWQKHSMLVRNAAQLRRIATLLEVLISALTVLAIILAVTMISVRLRYDQIHEDVLRGALSDDQIREMVDNFPYTRITGVLHFWMLVFPISVGILMTLQSHFQFAKKWARVSLAASQVASEIHLFLGNAGDRYSAGGAVACDRFLKQLQDVTTRLSMAGVREEDFAGSEDGFEDAFGTDPSILTEHVKVHIYGMDAESWLTRRIRSPMCLSACRALLDDGWTHRIDGSALLAPLSTEAYIEMRVAPLMTAYSRMIRETSSLRFRLQSTIALLLLLSTGMVVFSASVWIPVFLALATTTGTLLQWVAPLDTLTAMNSAMTALKSVDMQCAAMGVWEQRSPEMLGQLVSVTEGISLVVASALCRVPLMPDVSYNSDAKKQEALIVIEDFSSNHDGHSRTATRAGSRSGSRTGSRFDSRAGSRPMSRQQSRGASRASSRPGSAPGTPRSRAKRRMGAWM